MLFFPCLFAADRPSFDQILEELTRIKARWGAARSSTDSSVLATAQSSLFSTTSDSILQQQTRWVLFSYQWLPSLLCIIV